METLEIEDLKNLLILIDDELSMGFMPKWFKKSIIKSKGSHRADDKGQRVRTITDNFTKTIICGQ